MEKDELKLEEHVFSKLSETDVGITEYLLKDAKGFDCILKHRYSDFLVNEIDQFGNVVWIKKSEDEGANKETGENVPKEIVEKIESEEDVDKIVNEQFIFLFKDSPADVPRFKEFLYKFAHKYII